MAANNATTTATTAQGKPSRGYHKLASLMSVDSETAIFRRFTKLNMLVLMSLQAELMDLEDAFEQTCFEDDQSGDDTRQKFSVDFKALRNAKAGNDIQWQALMDIKSKMKEYNKTLLEIASVQGLSKPNDRQLRFLRDWLVDPKMGKSEIRGRQGRTWNAKDLVVLKGSDGERAPFSAWVSGSVLRFFDRIWGFKHKSWSQQVDAEAGIVFYEETKLTKYSKAVVTIIASLIPIVCIVVLYVLKSNGWRLGTMAFFTAAFAAILVIFTSAKEVEIFAGTAAFAAVEVVFIGSALTNSTGSG
ncbi:hypothetical protein G7Y89_g8437 [Cudoniella acicularis]|uniref:DUF6594 domain-containing protein n=1 Tax=Cudoniella acicularis TaxID=354080 RepID=A0A8H4RJD1_9HELO|nr:hypothetical protein G7Y89_g8437 [Cudoniella acicularis]